MKLSTLVKTALYMSRFAVDLFFIWLTLGWKIRKARKAFEKELLKNGVPRDSAKAMAKKYSSVKDNFVKSLRGYIDWPRYLTGVHAKS